MSTPKRKLVKGKRIGSGLFTTAYSTNLKDKVFVESSDYIKECMALGWFPNSRLFPKVSFGLERNTYIMPYYDKVRAPKKQLTPKDYEVYQELRHVFDNIKGIYGYDMNDLITVFKRDVTNKRVRNALIEAVEACGNYGADVCFEISPRNIAVSKSGRLVLLDCFFIRSQMREVSNEIIIRRRNKRRNKGARYNGYSNNNTNN